MEKPPFDTTTDIAGVIRCAKVEEFGSGVFTVTLTATDPDAPGVQPAVEFTAAQRKFRTIARYEDGERLEIHDEPERQELAFAAGMRNPAGAALNLPVLALLTDCQNAEPVAAP